MFFLLEASLVSFLPSSLAGCLTGWWHRRAEEPSELSSWTGQAAPAPRLPSSGRPRPLQTCFPTSQVHIQVSVYFRNPKWEVLFSGYPLFILACFLDVFLACWTSGLREGSVLALPKSSLWLGSFSVHWCVEAILTKQKSQVLAGQVSRERRTSLQLCK